MSATVVKLGELKQELRRKRGRTGICQNRQVWRDRPDFERRAAGIDEPGSSHDGRFAWSMEAQERMAHWLAQWGPLLVLATVAAWLGWLLLG